MAFSALRMAAVRYTAPRTTWRFLSSKAAALELSSVVEKVVAAEKEFDAAKKEAKPDAYIISLNNGLTELRKQETLLYERVLAAAPAGPEKPVTIKLYSSESDGADSEAKWLTLTSQADVREVLTDLGVFGLVNSDGDVVRTLKDLTEGRTYMGWSTRGNLTTTVTILKNASDNAARAFERQVVLAATTKVQALHPGEMVSNVTVTFNTGEEGKSKPEVVLLADSTVYPVEAKSTIKQMRTVEAQCAKHIRRAKELYPTHSVGLIVVGDYFPVQMQRDVKTAFKDQCDGVLCGTRNWTGISIE